MELGLHKEADDSVDLLEKQRRRRVFWQCYMIDRYSSTTLDRPFVIDDCDIGINFPADANDEEIEASTELRDLDSFCRIHGPSSLSETTIFFVSLRLRQVSSHIHTEFSRLRREQGEIPQKKYLMAGKVHVVLNSLLQELQEWRNNTPAIQNPACLYETQDWYDILYARERLSVVRRAVDLAPKSEGLPSKTILSLFLESALQTIERYYRLCNNRGNFMTHTRSYFHMLFTAGLSVMYCISVSKNTKRETLLAASEGLFHCEETLVGMATQLPDARSYVSVFEALHRDISRKLRLTIDNAADGTASAGASLSLIHI